MLSVVFQLLVKVEVLFVYFDRLGVLIETVVVVVRCKTKWEKVRMGKGYIGTMDTEVGVEQDGDDGGTG